MSRQMSAKMATVSLDYQSAICDEHFSQKRVLSEINYLAFKISFKWSENMINSRPYWYC